jgi:NCS1 family nucleobase:cation symporter-1
VLIIDYYFIRKTQLDVDELYREGGAYSYASGWNIAAVIAFVAGVAPNIPGFLNTAFPASFPHVSDGFKTIYTYAWFVGVLISAIVYGAMMKGRPVAALRPAAQSNQ